MIHPEEEALLLNALDLVVFERVLEGSLVIVCRPPAWFERICPSTTSRRYTQELAANMPFIETFLADAEEHWASFQARLYAGNWAQRDMDGFDRHIEAWAINAGARRFLVLRLLGVEFDETRRVLQNVRASNLANELSASQKKFESRLAGITGIWFARCCLGFLSLTSIAIFALQGLRLWEFQLGSDLMEWVGWMGLASLIGLIVVAKDWNWGAGEASLSQRSAARPSKHSSR
jgi:hypothetical protein